MKNILYFTFVLFLSFNPKNDDKEYYSVIAENGLIVRDEPNINSVRIGKLDCGEDIVLIEKTNKQLSIKNKGESINGYWYKVQSYSGLKGYVFNYFLLKKSEKPIQPSVWNNKIEVNSSHIFADEFDLRIYNYSLSSTEQQYGLKKKDTLLLYEEVFNEIGDKLLKVKRKKNYKRIDIYYSIVETLNEWGETENKDGIIPKWKGNIPYVKLESTNDFFYRIPVTEYENIRESTAKRLNLKRSADWDSVGEGWWYAKYQYKGLIVPYELKSVIFKVVTTDFNNKVTTKYIEIMLSYGC